MYEFYFAIENSTKYFIVAVMLSSSFLFFWNLFFFFCLVDTIDFIMSWAFGCFQNFDSAFNGAYKCVCFYRTNLLSPIHSALISSSYHCCCHHRHRSLIGYRHSLWALLFHLTIVKSMFFVAPQFTCALIDLSAY